MLCMKNLLSHLIHLTVITEFEIFFYIYYIVPFERKNIYKMFENQINYNDDIQLNYTYNKVNLLCYKEEERIEKYNENLFDICYYYIGAINFVLFIAFLYDLRKYYFLYFNKEMPRVLSSPKYLSAAFDIEMVPVDIEDNNNNNNNNNDNNIIKEKEGKFIVFYWNNSRFVAKMCETIQFIILLGVFEYIFFTYLFNKFKIISAKLIICNLLS